MKKRIFLNMVLLSSVSLIFISITLCFVFYRQFSMTAMATLRNRAEAFIDNSPQTAIEALTFTKSSDMRVTVIMPDGTVVFDNTANSQSLPNHLDRDEIRNALTIGFGQSTRFSNTLKKETVYYAVRLTDGYVLRVAKTSSSIFGVFVGILPIAAGVVLVMIIFDYLLAARLTTRIVDPINKVNLKSELTVPYDELAPFIRTIAKQREHIAEQLSDLQNRSDTISAIMNNMKEGIILTDKQGVILSANKSVLRIFEKDSTLDGKNILEFLRDVNFSGHVYDALAGESGEMSMECTGRTYRVYFSHVSGGGAIVLFLDITEKAKSEKLRREFSANVSHELKTPLTSIYAIIEMLYNGMIKENDKQVFYGHAKDEAGRLIALIDDILMLSKLDENGRQELYEDVELAATAAETIASLSQKAAEGKVIVHVSGKGIYMKASRSLMYEMFYNLIDNAIKYNKPGGTVNVDITNTKEQISIAVSDTGIGIPKEVQSRVFERFYRVDKSRSKKTGGTGLGLAIVKHIVMVHDGKIELISQQDKGTTITVSFYYDATNRLVG